LKKGVAVCVFGEGGVFALVIWCVRKAGFRVMDGLDKAVSGSGGDVGGVSDDELVAELLSGASDGRKRLRNELASEVQTTLYGLQMEIARRNTDMVGALQGHLADLESYVRGSKVLLRRTWELLAQAEVEAANGSGGRGGRYRWKTLEMQRRKAIALTSQVAALCRSVYSPVNLPSGPGLKPFLDRDCVVRESGSGFGGGVGPDSSMTPEDYLKNIGGSIDRADDNGGDDC
jgi:hypothetical protein